MIALPYYLLAAVVSLVAAALSLPVRAIRSLRAAPAPQAARLAPCGAEA
jgi:hypothetical protein